jgi:hypothetical protein
MMHLCRFLSPNSCSACMMRIHMCHDDHRTDGENRREEPHTLSHRGVAEHGDA